MELVNMIGHMQHWGLTPAAHLLAAYPFSSHPARPLRLLISGTSDIRHLLKTLCDLNEYPPNEKPSIEIYIHETNKELLCRALLFLHIIHETSLALSQRIQLFLDIYGNAMIKQRNARYLHNLRQDLLNFIHDQKKVATPLKRFVNLKHLKFDERDDLSEIIQSWSMKVPFQMQKQRDNKIRYALKERYDYRNNLIDWDFSMLLQECAPIIHAYHYRQWRLIGLAYQQRFSRYTEPNRTLASYAPGLKKGDRTSCLVRGYWGDIIISPYISIGTKCNYHQKDLLFKKANYKNIGHSIQIAEYNMNYWLERLEHGKRYSRHFRDYYRADEQTKKDLEKKNEEKKKSKKKKPEMEEIKEEEEQIQQEKQEKKMSVEEMIKAQKNPRPKPKQQQEEVLDSDEEAEKKRIEQYNEKDIDLQGQESDILQGFKNFNVTISPMAINSQKMISSAKYKQFFDVVCLGFSHSILLNKGVEAIIRKDGQILVEKGTYILPKKKQERKELNTKLRSLIQQKGFKQVELQQVAEEEGDLFLYAKK